MDSLQERLYQRKWFYGVVIVTLALLFVGWWTGSLAHLVSMSDRLLAIGRLFGLLAGWCVLLEIVLMSRVPFIERSFDLQEAAQLHRLNGYTLLLAIAGHTVFLLAAYAGPLHISWWEQFLAFNGGQYEDVLWATVGTVVFFVAGGLSVRLIRLRMCYEWWYAIHLTIYGAIVLGFLHQVKLGGDFIGAPWFLAYWYALYGLVFAVWLWYRVLRPVAMLVRHDFKVANVERLTATTSLVVITGRDVAQFTYDAGQYATWRFLAPELWHEAHPFSFVSSPGDGTLRLMVKASPDYMAKLGRLTPGARVVVDGPRGGFTVERATNDMAVLVAGGIGIAPLLPLARRLLENGKNVALLYAVRSTQDTVFGEELRQLKARGLRVCYFVDENGQRITADVLGQIAGINATVFVCGPDAMAGALTRELGRLGVPDRHIVTERFAF